MSYLKSAPSNLSNYKISRFRTKNALLRYFLTISWKNYCHIWNEHLRICLISKFCKETKMPKFGTKNAIFCYFWLKMHYLSIFRKTFKKNHCPIWNQHPQICLLQNFHEKTKIPNFEIKNAWFIYFWTGIWTQYCHIWNQHPRFCLTAEFRGKTKRPKFGTKNALF